MPLNEDQLTDEKRHGKKVPTHPKRNKQLTNAKQHAGKKKMKAK